MINDSLSIYISHLQLLSFFAGYPFIYALVKYMASDRGKKMPLLNKKWIELLPFAYALTGTLFLGLILKNISPDFSGKNITEQFQSPYLEIWGIMAFCFGYHPSARDLF